MSKYHNDSAHASDPGRIRLAAGRLEAYWEYDTTLMGFSGNFPEFTGMVDEHLQVGDSRAAVLLSVDPVLVAAYTDEIDCVVVLKFPAKIATDFGLQVGTRLLTVNTYNFGNQVVRDLSPGEGNLGNYCNFYPLIAEFLSDNSARIESRKSEIDEAVWARCAEMGQAFIQATPAAIRNGSPFHSNKVV
jgi:hypothetical protein